MKQVFVLMGMAAICLLTSSCFLVSVPVKATGEIIEKSAHASGRAIVRGVNRASTPDGSDSVDAYGADDHNVPGVTYDEYGYPEE